MPRKIMIIDDEPDIRAYLAAAAEDNGFEPLTLGAEETVIKIIADNKPELVVLDIMMPMRSGISIYKEIRTSPSLRHIPIILISGMAGMSEFMKKDFYKLIEDDRIPPPDGFIEKPVKPEDLFRLIENLRRKHDEIPKVK
jgi:two-component system, OmpR family, phosphate regulon response regulator PhoB